MSSMTTEQPSDQNLLLIGIFARVHLLGGTVVRKVPRSTSEEDAQPILHEADIYSLLGDHPRIAQCLSIGRIDHVDVKYYPKGDIVIYLQKNQDSIAPSLRSKWFRQIIEAVHNLHEHGVIHSDLALRQFFVEVDLDARLGDFDSSQYPGRMALGYEKASHCLPRDCEEPNTIMSDIFALGSTLYELIAGKAPYSELYPIEPEAVLRSSDLAVILARIDRGRQVDTKIETLYTQQVFPDVSTFAGGDIILACWKGYFTTANDALLRLGQDGFMQERTGPCR
ncbi:MAG: hypothetical protein M4579_006985 [Chaenotheca gracillima]|nr:MAG: hypothetical protein M4579_006985 [Chaenotheca gracillima]